MKIWPRIFLCIPILFLCGPVLSSSNFDKAIKVVLAHEGVFSNDSNDSGGATKWGISLRYLKDIHLDVDKNGEIDAQDVTKLTEKTAIMIYKKNWWDKFNYEKIKDPVIATKVFDLSVNMGSKQAHKILQKSINDLLKNDVVVDGVLGKKTFDAANSIKGPILLMNIRMESSDFYEEIVKEKPSLHKFLNGWLNRAAY